MLTDRWESRAIETQTATTEPLRCKRQGWRLIEELISCERSPIQIVMSTRWHLPVQIHNLHQERQNSSLNSAFQFQQQRHSPHKITASENKSLAAGITYPFSLIFPNSTISPPHVPPNYSHNGLPAPLGFSSQTKEPPHPCHSSNITKWLSAPHAMHLPPHFLEQTYRYLSSFPLSRSRKQ
jgi:hypothetical protein